jgi:hypothetical protein
LNIITIAYGDWYLERSLARLYQSAWAPPQANQIYALKRLLICVSSWLQVVVLAYRSYLEDYMSEPEDPSQDGEIPNIDELLSRLASATTPLDALHFAPDISDLVAGLDPLKTANLLAGLITDPRFQANHIRLDWAVRVVLAMANGHRRPRRGEIGALLNDALQKARVTRLEDPIEDLFAEPLLTRSGDYPIFSGTWEKAAILTEMLMEAFVALPSGKPKDNALRSVFALLAVSAEIVSRSELAPGIVGSGEPFGELVLPSDDRLLRLAARVRFSNSDLARLDISEGNLEPFFLNLSDTSGILANVPGNTPLEFRPLLKVRDGFIVALPSNISTAIRAHLINVAVEFDLAVRLQRNLLRAQANLLMEGGFDLVPISNVKTCEDQIYCEAMKEISAGRYLHIVLSVDGFRHWPHRAFGSVTRCEDDWINKILQNMSAAKRTTSERAGFVGGMTLWMASGWGSGRSFSFNPTADLEDWPLIIAEPADLSTMFACENGKLSDVWRLQKQTELVERQGFNFHNASGFLNMFHWWRSTDYALLPPHEIDIAPPLDVDFGSNLLLEARQEAFKTFGRRTLMDESGRWHRVGRLDRGEAVRDKTPAYASIDDTRKGILSGVVVHNDSLWWLKLSQEQSVSSRDIFETWRTVMIWIGQTMPPFLATVKNRHLIKVIALHMSFDALPDDRTFLTGSPVSDEEINDAIEISVDPTNHGLNFHLKPNWFAGFYRPDNYAERKLAARLLAGVCEIFGIQPTEEELAALVLNAAGSTDFRHRHAFQVERAVEQLGASGLVKSFSKISVSAAALAKCGAVWPVHPREDGVRIEGKEACLSLVSKFIAHCQSTLIEDVKPYDRTAFIVAMLDGIQSAIAEEGHWRRSARALRAIHGVDQDFDLSLKHALAANGILRANSMLALIAAAEAASTSGRAPGKMDLDELQARALQLFQSADTYPAFFTDRIDPSIHISPTGEILYQHDFHGAVIERASKIRHARERSQSTDEYLKRFEAPSEPLGLDPKFIAAIEDEYGVPMLVFRELTNATAILARTRNQGVMVLRRSELLKGLREIENLSDLDFGPLVDRLTLPQRNGWNDIPSGATLRDFDLSKFDRRLSLIGRPIVCLEQADDPLLAVAPAVIERALMHNINGASNGILQNEFWNSPKMVAFAGSAGARLGKEFNETVAARLSEFGLNATPSVKPSACLNQKKTEELERLGDIDVLAISPNNRIVWVIEAKDLKLCRTLGEAAQRLSKYKGVIGDDGKPDLLLRHLQRVDFIRTHVAQLGRRLKLAAVPEVRGVLVVNSPQPMEQLKGEYSQDSTAVMLDSIGEVPWDTGWQVK